jgi:serralysin
MQYPVPRQLTIGDFEIGWNNDLSSGDKTFAARMYPRGA